MAARAPRESPVSMSNMLGMWLRKVPYPLVVDTRITGGQGRTGHQHG